MQWSTMVIQANQIGVNDMALRQNQVEWVQETVSVLERAWNTSPTQRKRIATRQAIELERMLKSEFAEATVISYLTEIRAFMAERSNWRCYLSDRSLYDKVQTAVTAFTATIDDLINDAKIAYKNQTQKRLASNIENQKLVVIDEQPIIAWSRSVLAKASEMLHKYGSATLPWQQAVKEAHSDRSLTWMQVVIALAIATGRRHSEIQSDSTVIYGIDGDVIYWSGQRKQETVRLEADELDERFNPSAIGDDGLVEGIAKVRTLKPLVEPKLVADGYCWLRKAGKIKKMTGNPVQDGKAVNGAYTRYISETMKDVRAELNLPEMPDNKSFSLHTFRALYVRIMVEREQPDPYAIDGFIESLIGDTSKEVHMHYKLFKLAADKGIELNQ